jgi:lambda repressor-like predicted transcriptional regulator
MPATAAAPAPAPGPLPNPSFVIVQIDPTVDPTTIDERLQAFVTGGSGSLLFPLKDGWHAVSRGPGKELRVTHGGTNDSLVAFLAGLPGIIGVGLVPADELLRRYQESVADEQTVPGPRATAQELWNLGAVRAHEAWAKFGGWEAIEWGTTRVGHLDTGYTEHPAFGPWVNGRSPSLLPQDGSNFFDGSPGPADPMTPKGSWGHGTRICSVLCGADVVNGFTGVAPRVPVVPYRVCDFVVIDTLWQRNNLGGAIDHAVGNAGCSVLSISLGDPCLAAPSMGAAVDRAYERGVIIVAAAGNYTSEVTYPGRYSRTIAAGGIAADDEPWNSGSRGISVDVSAPADLIWRADWIGAPDGSLTPVYGNRSGGAKASGTSYATVHVSGAAALWRAWHGPALDIYAARPWQYVEAFRTVLKASARKPVGWNDRLFGAGILDIEALLDTPLPAPDSLVYQDRLAEKERT